MRFIFVLIQKLSYSGCIMTKKNIGSSFDDFLREESLLDNVSNEASERVEAWVRANSHIMAAVHETASGMHPLRFLDGQEMQKFDDAHTDIKPRALP